MNVGVVRRFAAPLLHAVAVSCLVLVPHSAFAQLKAGTAKRKVTPPLSVPYLTSSGRGTNGPFKDIFDDLYARALVLDDGQRAVALVAVDSIGYDNAILGPGRHFTHELRQLVAARTPLKPEAVMLSATHTHQAPETIGLTPFRESPGVPQWLETHLQDLAAVVVEAWNQRVAVRAYRGSVAVTGIGRNRRILLKDGKLNRQGPLPPADQLARPAAQDEDLTVLYFETDQGRPHSVVLNYTAHPVVTMLSGSVSADYCGQACDLVERQLAGAVCLFTQGGCGNINSVKVSTGAEDARLLGHRLGQAAVGAIQRFKSAKPLADTTVQYGSQELVLNARECPPLDEAERAVRDDPSEKNKVLLRLARKLAEGPIRAEVQVMGLGNVRWVALPGEPFVELALALKKAGASFVVGYGNGYVGYIPVRSAYDEGGYETGPGTWSRIAPGSAEELQAVGVKLLGRLDERLPRVAPHEPADALKTFQTLHGFRLELVASEPLIASPVAMAYDENGRAYVVEMRDYPYTDKKTHRPWQDNVTDLPIGRVSLLVDTDADGRMDRATVFADGLSWPTGVVCWKGGVFVTATPDLWYFKDSDGDGRADIRLKLFSGFRKYNVQAVINNPLWGLDRWIYCAGGTNGGNIRPADRPDSPPLRLSQNDFRFNPAVLQLNADHRGPRVPAGALEAISGGQRFGHTMDDWGNRFLCLVSRPARHVVLPEHYLKRNPFLPVPSTLHDAVPLAGPLPFYPLSPPEPWRAARARQWQAQTAGAELPPEMAATGYFTGASGVTMYRGAAYPREFYGNLFIGEVAGNLVHRLKLRPDGVTFLAERADPQTEFVRSSDNWFRPVNFVNAPDGTLHILDMYRETIEHPWSIPDDLHEQVDLLSGRDRGRIYRLTPPGFRLPAGPALGQAGTSELVAALENPNGWWRETAHRLIFERQDPAAAGPLRQLLRGSAKSECRLLALYALDGLAALDDAELRAALGDPAAQVRAHAVRLAESRLAGSAALLERVLTLADDPDIRVRFQVAFSLGEVRDPHASTALSTILRRDSDNGWVRTAVLSSAVASCGEMLVGLLSDRSPAPSGKGGDGVEASRRETVRHLAVVVGARHQGPEVRRVLDTVAAASAIGEIERAVLAGLGDGLKRSGKPLRRVAEAESPRHQKLVDAVLHDARDVAADAAAPFERRLDAMEWLGYEKFERAAPTLTALLQARQPPAVQLAAVRTLSGFRDPQVSAMLLEPWRGYSPSLRGEVVESLLGRKERILALLDAVGSGTVSASQIPPHRQTQLLNHPDATIRQRAAAVLKQQPLSPRAEIIARYRQALRLRGDRDRGQKTFQRDCMGCHRFAGQGHAVGPDLETVRHRAPDEVLVGVLDPNREVPPQHMEYLVALTDGRVVSGMITAETATTVTLRRAEGIQETLLRTNIEEIRSTAKSIMPEGLEQKITVQEMADLLSFLLQ